MTSPGSLPTGASVTDTSCTRSRSSPSPPRASAGIRYSRIPRFSRLSVWRPDSTPRDGSIRFDGVRPTLFSNLQRFEAIQRGETVVSGVTRGRTYEIAILSRYRGPGEDDVRGRRPGAGCQMGDGAA